MLRLNGMNIAILGFADQGKSAYEYWNHPPAGGGNELTICDQNGSLELPPGASAQLGAGYLQGLDRFELLVRTPALHPSKISAANSPNILAKVTTNTNEFFRVCPSKNIIGVTGTKGKGTTSTLIAKMLEASGLRVHLGGNIDTPPLEMLNPPSGGGIQADDYVVLELANFQLIDLKYSPHIGVCLMVVPEHLDWHRASSPAYSHGSDQQSAAPGGPIHPLDVPSGMPQGMYETPGTTTSQSSDHNNRQGWMLAVNEYVTAKQQMFARQSLEDIAIYFAGNQDSKRIASVSAGRKLPYMQAPGAEVKNDQIMIDGQVVCPVSDLKLLGQHNWQNVCAAVTVVWSAMVGVTEPQALIKTMRTVLTTFTGLEHRLEFVREVSGVKYYDDSFGTAPETAIVALEAFNDEPKVIILGGSDKGADFTELARTVVRGNVRAAVIMGVTGPKIISALQAHGFNSIVEGGKTMREVVVTAGAHALPGDIVLLSTACASFDMFANYKDRGEQFMKEVLALSETER